MPPKITRVRWSASGLPWGMSFNEQTGTFSGKPDEAGEYIIPVTVETNYGTDTKDVVIKVEKNERGLYVTPNHPNWGSKDVKKGTSGFYPVEIPKVEKLSEYPYGFRAYTQSGEVYGCGLTGLPDYAITMNYQVSSIVNLEVNHFRAVNFSKLLYSSYPIQNHLISFAVLTADNKMTLKHVLRYTVQVSSGSSRVNTYLSTVDGEEIKDLPVSDIGWNDNGISWLSEDGRQYNYVRYTLTGINTVNAKAHATVETLNLGYRAVKLIGSAKVLSEGRLIDNNPDNFTHGIIKDAWGYNTSMYVQTIDNQLYEYMPDTQIWDFLGVYDVKKIEVLANNCVLMLMKNGQLYHKGIPIRYYGSDGMTTIVDSHSTLTNVFPTYNFADFTFSRVQSNSVDGFLLVLKE